MDWRLLGCVALAVAEAGRRGAGGGGVVTAGEIFKGSWSGLPREGLQGLL